MVVGFGLIVAGTAFVYWPASLVVAGCGLLCVGWMGAADGANVDDSPSD